MLGIFSKNLYGTILRNGKYFKFRNILKMLQCVYPSKLWLESLDILLLMW